MKVWLNELEASLKESKKQKLRDMRTSCQLKDVKCPLGMQEGLPHLSMVELLENRCT